MSKSEVILRNGLYEIVHVGTGYSLIKKGVVLATSIAQERIISIAERTYKVRGEWVKP